MDLETEIGELSPAEESYFESGGNVEIPQGEQAAAEEKIAEPETPKAEEPKVEKMVSLAALHEERNRRREIDRQYRETQQQLAELKGKLSIVERLAPEKTEAKEPTVEEDIFGVVKNTTQTVADIQKQLKEQADQQKAEGERNALISAYRSDAAKFETENPDFKTAYNHLLQSRAAELQTMGYTDPRALHEALTNDEMSIAQMALSQGKSAAEIIYNLAKQRGYAKADDKPSAAEKLANIEKGQAANKSLSSTGGTAGEADMTAEALLKMPMDEFEKYAEKNPAKVRRLMGG